ncbi:N-acetylmuramoyl-L-alanine amidase [Phormidium sp. CCY1219]|uniref:N-acetylmuramoyl-L-alanine amidase n=1 Tax=Phormidium sp. CCY1219 TaxID=2886104 RepID=UPI002D1F816C|nr:N-acetylmuramoyl-L-alanine amidase [Phormidium sp. CCY1219]MEB3830412.1 N-acetylmuramoyl-L-alanine amidase [Phormidium sp. CCY1219]
MTQKLNFPALNARQLRKNLIVKGLVPALVGAFVLAAPAAEAARLDSWRFEANQNRLSFRTIGGVQPTAKLISNPTRLVIDLPGTRLGRRTVRERIGGTVREIRLGQFNSQTSRIVVELAEGYTLDPEAIEFQGVAPNQWIVQLPAPQRKVEPAPRDPAIAVPSVTEASTLLQDIEITDRGFVLRTSGQSPRIDLKPSRDRTWLTLDLPGVSLSPQLSQGNLFADRLGVERVQVMQLSDDPPFTRLIFNLSDRRQQWQAQVSDRGAVLLWPSGETPPELTAEMTQLATIESIEVANNGSEVIVNSDRPIAYKTEWDPQTLAYRLTLFSAQLTDRVEQLRPDTGSSILWVRPTQEDPQTVSILVQPAAGIQVIGVEQPNPEQVAIQLQPRTVATKAPDSAPRTEPDKIPISVPPPTNPAPQPARANNQRIAIVIDPGHGGRDPGAIGIGGLREKDVVTDISRQVAAILEQNGVTAIMTREDDRTLSLAARTSLANRVDADLFVSIHANAISMSRPDVNGLETFYYRAGRSLAQYIQNSMLQTFDDMRNRGVRRARFYVLRHTDMPAVLVETGFLTGRHDVRVLANAQDRARMAEAIARGILQYIRQNP